MTYKESIHSHQSEILQFLTPDYVPYKISPSGEKVWGIISYKEGSWNVVYQRKLPKFGGYLAKDSVYGDPKYCANATRNHLKHQELYGFMPHLVFFDTEESAQHAGFRQCGHCFKK